VPPEGEEGRDPHVLPQSHLLFQDLNYKCSSQEQTDVQPTKKHSTRIKKPNSMWKTELFQPIELSLIHKYTSFLFDIKQDRQRQGTL
jgi:hypothetical protein